MCLDFLYNFFETFLVLRRIQQYVRRSLCKLAVILVRFNITAIFSKDFRKNTKIMHTMKLHLVGKKLFHADAQTDGQT